MKFWRPDFQDIVRGSLISGVANRICSRTTAFHCRSRKYAINFCLCSPRGDANTRGDFAAVIRKCRGIPRTLCCLSQLSHLSSCAHSSTPSPPLSLSLLSPPPFPSPSVILSVSKCFALIPRLFSSTTCALNSR